MAVLGLEPGADAAAIDQAYRRLIKQYHPDREGGDGVRAAEIIHAYRELRGGRALVDPLQFNDHLARPARRRSNWPLVLVAALLAGAAGALAMRPDLLPQLPVAAKAVAIAGLGHKNHATDPMDQPLHDHAIRAAVEQARDLYRRKDQIALAEASRACQANFHEKPTLELLDRCAAFDNVVIGLLDRDPLSDGGPFAPLAVTGRQWNAASALSDDYIAIDSRLDRIRVAVELALAAAQNPQPEPAASAPLRQANPKPRASLPQRRSHRAASGRTRSNLTTGTI